MNRQEAIKKLEELYEWNFIHDKLEQEQKQNLEDVIKYLRQPISLTDFLGWEEDKEYLICGDRYKLVNNEILFFDGRYNVWVLSLYSNVITELLEVPKIKKYYLKLHQKWIDFYSIKPDESYLNNHTPTNKYLLESKKTISPFKTQFTTEEIEEIKKLDYIIFEQFELIEVGEDE